MAEHFREVSTCPVCLTYLERPVYLKCGYICCGGCLASLPRAPGGAGWRCPSCSLVSQKEDIRPNAQLGRLVAKVKALEPQLQAVLQMNPKILKFQVEVTLDADTAHSHLIISEDLRSVRCGYSRQNRRPRAKRFDYAICVLGSPRFSSGRHYWEVDVRATKEWDVGVCRDAAKRHGPILLSPEFGFWTVSLRKGLFQAGTMPVILLSVRPPLHRVGVFLDMNLGTVSFYDVSDGAHVFTFTRIPAAETLRPLFAPANRNTNGQGVLRICPATNTGTAGSPAGSGRDLGT